MRGLRASYAPAWGAHGCAALCAGLLLWAVGQPIFTDDLWWHLGLGRAFAALGPWLAEDPLLFAAAGPPRPASWLADVGLAQLVALGGFQSLRVLHVALVAAILTLVWSIARRASGSPLAASAICTLFIVLAAYRLVQLRPQLVTLLALPLLYRWTVEPRDGPSGARIAASAGLAALWANLHAGFVLGPGLIGAALVGWLASARGRSASGRLRCKRLLLALAAVSLATLANPSGIGTHLSFLEAGGATPALDHVIDEWRHWPLFAGSTPRLPPSPLAWGVVWAGLLSAGALVVRRRGSGVDPALGGCALLGLAALLGAVRFAWLGLFGLLWIAAALRAQPLPRWGRVRVATLVFAATLALLVAFVRIGDWPSITRGLPTHWPGYAQPYAAGKYYAHAIWMLRDAEVHGNLYTDYFLGGFAGYWLAPSVRTLTNGSLNIPSETLSAAASIAAGRGHREGEDLPALLERLGVDLFLGIRLPEATRSERPRAWTTAHLEGVPGWIPIFRNLNSALYLRPDGAEDARLERVAHHYREQGVPFDPARGFDPAAVIRRAPRWAVAHALVPEGMPSALLHGRNASGPRAALRRDRIAAVFAVLGLYDRAIEIDRAALARDEDARRPRRRLVWSLLRSGRSAEAAREGEALAARDDLDPLSRRIAETAREVAERPEQGAETLARLPLLTPAEAAWVMAGTPAPPVRAQPPPVPR